MRIDNKMVLIDLDASAEIDTGFSCSKYSSAYIPPEMICLEGEKHAVKSWSLGKNFDGQDVIVKEGHYSELIHASHTHDVWSFGVVLYQLFTGYLLFSADNNDNIDDDDMKQLYEFTDEFKQKRLMKINNLVMRNLISQMLNKDPSKRPSMEKILKHPFVTNQSNPVRV